MLVRQITSQRVELNSGTYTNITLDASYDGYTPLGIIGFAAGSAQFYVAGARMSGENAVLTIGAHAGSSGSPDVRVLYMKNFL